MTINAAQEADTVADALDSCAGDAAAAAAVEVEASARDDIKRSENAGDDASQKIRTTHAKSRTPHLDSTFDCVFMFREDE